MPRRCRHLRVPAVARSPPFAAPPRRSSHPDRAVGSVADAEGCCRRRPSRASPLPGEGNGAADRPLREQLHGRAPVVPGSAEPVPATAPPSRARTPTGRNRDHARGTRARPRPPPRRHSRDAPSAPQATRRRRPTRAGSRRPPVFAPQRQLDHAGSPTAPTSSSRAWLSPTSLPSRRARPVPRCGLVNRGRGG